MTNNQTFKMGDKYASIGFLRSDGDFELLATFNNGGEFMSDEDFYNQVTSTAQLIANNGDDDSIEILCREDAIDIVSLQ